MGLRKYVWIIQKQMITTQNLKKQKEYEHNLRKCKVIELPQNSSELQHGYQKNNKLNEFIKQNINDYSTMNKIPFKKEQPKDENCPRFN